MIFKLKPKKNIKVNDERVIQKFALLPIRIDDEIRWLEKCTIHQVYEKIETFTIDESGAWPIVYHRWRNLRFLEENRKIPADNVKKICRNCKHRNKYLLEENAWQFICYRYPSIIYVNPDHSCVRFEYRDGDGDNVCGK